MRPTAPAGSPGGPALAAGAATPLATVLGNNGVGEVKLMPQAIDSYPSCGLRRRGNGEPIMSKRKHAIEAYFQSGVRLHGAGRLQEAEGANRQGTSLRHPRTPTACTC